MIERATPTTASYVINRLSDDAYLRQERPREFRRIAIDTVRQSPLAWAVYARDGEPVCLFGADGGFDDQWGSAWMFATNSASKAGLELVRGCKTAVMFSRNVWPQLRIKLERRTPKQERFLSLIGFKTRRTFRLNDNIYKELIL